MGTPSFPARFVYLLATLAVGPGAHATDLAAADDRFESMVQPFLKNNCLPCHGHDGPKGKLDLSVYTTARSVVKDYTAWGLVRDRLEAEEMPPAEARRQPTPEERRAVVDWIKATLDREALKNAGDPGLVLARRLSNAEFDYTIRDLTGVDIRPTREFPVDPANQAGFDNSGESLAMSPALLKKYLAAARRRRRPPRAQTGWVRLCTRPGGNRNRSRQVLRAPDHRFLQAARGGLTPLFPGRLAIAASCGTRQTARNAARLRGRGAA